MNLKIKFLPYEKLKEEGIEEVMKEVERNTIVMIDGKLSATDEAELIEKTMKKISDKFSGIELSSLELPASAADHPLARIKDSFIELVIGKKRGLTVIGPSRLIKRIKKNPKELFLEMSG
ncbi:MAG: DUF2073 domain-containing protein [Candidatus Aenigmarchaeota archaeon]|nr:DUF2073 domain-containing protein [Candidatus Aenigmarchaeota archaeon]